MTGNDRFFSAVALLGPLLLQELVYNNYEFEL